MSQGYDFSQHLDLTASHWKLIPDEVAMKCTIADTPQNCVTKARELQAAGMTDIAIFVTTQDEAGARTTLRRFDREVIPPV